MKYILVVVAVLVLLVGCTATQPCEEDFIAFENKCVELNTEASGPIRFNIDANLDDAPLKGAADGFVARPNGTGPWPGIILVHEWWGLNNDIKDLARQLAQEGFAVVVIDLFSGEVTTNPAVAIDYSRQILENQDFVISELAEGIELLKGAMNSPKVAVMGQSFGATQALLFSIREDVDATVLYYGDVRIPDSRIADISGPVFGVFGKRDPAIRPELVQNFTTQLNNAGIENEIYIYSGHGHGFATPISAGFDEVAANDAWDRTIDFLDLHLN